MTEKMLTPGEIRKAPAQVTGWTVEVGSICGGSFTQVVVRDSLGVRAWCRSFKSETDALREFASRKA